MSRKSCRRTVSIPQFEKLESRALLSAAALSALAPSQSSLGAITADRVAKPAASEKTVAGLGTGLTGEYFAGNDFQKAVLVRSDPTINFASGLRPDPSLDKGAFSVRWTGQIQPLYTQTYTFTTHTAGGVELSVNGQVLINGLAALSTQTKSATISLTAGQKYDISMEYIFKGSGSASAILQWSSHSQHKQAIPKTALFPDENVALPAGTGLIDDYFAGDAFATKVLTRNDPLINFNFHNGTPNPSVAHRPFSIIASGLITPSFSETYTFYARSDDGVRLYVNGQLVVNDFTEHKARLRQGTITLQAGVAYDFTVDYFAGPIPPSSLQVYWSSPSTPMEIIPASAFTNLGQLTAGAVQVTGTSPDEIDLSWAGSAAATGYIIQRSSDDATWSQIGTTTAPTTTYADTTVTAGATYYYRIIAVDAAGDANPDNPVSATASSPSAGVPASPAGVSATPNSATQITVGWDAVAGATDYLVEQSTTANGSSGWTSVGHSGGATQLASTGLTASTAYYYRVSALNSSGQSIPSATVTATTLSANSLAAPANLTASATSDTVATLNWNDVTGETGFTIQSSPNGTSGWTTIATVGTGTTTLAVGGLTASTTYYYQVIANNGSISSSPSNVATVTTDTAIPAYAALTTIYGVDSSNVYSINTATGATTVIGTVSFATEGAGRDPVSGKLFYISANTTTVQIASWNPAAPSASANTTLATGITLPAAVYRAAFRADGTLFFTAGDGDLYAFNTTTNTVTAMGTIEAGGSQLPGSLGDMAFAPNGNLYIEVDQSTSSIYEVNASDISSAGGAGSTIPATLVGPTGSSDLQLAFGQNGVLFGYDSDNGQLYTVNLSSGTATTVPGATPTEMTLGDLASAPVYADLAVSQTASTLTAGSNGTYTLTVVNNGPNSITTPITLTDSLPTGLSIVSIAGNGWTYSVQGQTVTLVYAGNTAANATLPTVTLTVAVSNSAAASVTNTAVVSTAVFDQNTANNTSSLMTAVAS